MSVFLSHDGTIKTDETFSPGYVSMRCDRWGLPDNTMGKIGWHVFYRPLHALGRGDNYDGNELVTREMQDAIREHYALADAAADAEAAAEAAAETAALGELEWKSPRGLTLAEEMDREDTIY